MTLPRPGLLSKRGPKSCPTKRSVQWRPSSKVSARALLPMLPMLPTQMHSSSSCRCCGLEAKTAVGGPPQSQSSWAVRVAAAAEATDKKYREQHELEKFRAAYDQRQAGREQR